MQKSRRAAFAIDRNRRRIAADTRRQTPSRCSHLASGPASEERRWQSAYRDGMARPTDKISSVPIRGLAATHRNGHDLCASDDGIPWSGVLDRLGPLSPSWASTFPACRCDTPLREIHGPPSSLYYRSPVGDQAKTYLVRRTHFF